MLQVWYVVCTKIQCFHLHRRYKKILVFFENQSGTRQGPKKFNLGTRTTRQSRENCMNIFRRNSDEMGQVKNIPGPLCKARHLGAWNLIVAVARVFSCLFRWWRRTGGSKESTISCQMKVGTSWPQKLQANWYFTHEKKTLGIKSTKSKWWHCHVFSQIW